MYNIYIYIHIHVYLSICLSVCLSICLLRTAISPFWQVKSSIPAMVKPPFWPVPWSGSLSGLCGTWAGWHQGCQGRVGGLFIETWGILRKSDSSLGFPRIILVLRRGEFMRIWVSRNFWAPKNRKHHASRTVTLCWHPHCEPSKRVRAKLGSLPLTLWETAESMHMLVFFFPICVASLTSALILCFSWSVSGLNMTRCYS